MSAREIGKRCDAGFVVLIALVSLCSSACTYRVTPPVNPASPAEVFVIDYGQHSGLVLPAEGGELREYAYGEWEWFAKNNQAWWRGPAILIVPSAGTLGVRPAPLAIEELRRASQPASESRPDETATFAEAVHVVTVDAARAAALRAELDAVLLAERERGHFNPQQGMLFVPYERRYSACFHCNSATAAWLRVLGCEVSGLGGIADFVVTSAARTPARSALPAAGAAP